MAAGLPSRAAILYGSTDISLASPDYFTSFEGPALFDNDLVTTEFLPDGFDFSGDVRFRTCGDSWPNTAGGWTPTGYIANNGPGCTNNVTDDSFSIHLNGKASALSLTSHTHMAFPASGILVEVLNDGITLDSLLITDANDSWCCSPRFFLVEGLVFDEIRFTETDPTAQPWIAIDNVGYNAAVPEPGALAILASGMVILAIRRRRK